MRLFIQIIIGDWKQSGYHKPWLHYASSLSSDMMGTDLDNQSESIVADLVIKLIDQSEKVFLLIESHDNQLSLGASERVMRHAIAEKDRLETAVITGIHSNATALLGELGEKLVLEDDEEKVRQHILRFAQ